MVLCLTLLQKAKDQTQAIVSYAVRMFCSPAALIVPGGAGALATHLYVRERVPVADSSKNLHSLLATKSFNSGMPMFIVRE